MTDIDETIDDVRDAAAEFLKSASAARTMSSSASR